MKMRACLVKLMDEHPIMLDYIREKVKVNGVPVGDDLRIWKEYFLPFVAELLNKPSYYCKWDTKKCLMAIFDMFKRMLRMRKRTAVYVSVHTMEFFHQNPDLLEAAEPYMSKALKQAYDAYCAQLPACESRKETEQNDNPGLQQPKPGFGSSAMVDQFAPIIPFVGAGGLRLGWTREQVEKVTGPLGEWVTVAQQWRRFTVSDQLWLYFNGSGDGLEKIVTLPGYGGRLFDLIDTHTPVEELSWREPSLVWNETLKFYTSPKGVLIQPVDGKCAHITVFDEQWKYLCQ